MKFKVGDQIQDRNCKDSKHIIIGVADNYYDITSKADKRIALLTKGYAEENYELDPISLSPLWEALK